MLHAQIKIAIHPTFIFLIVILLKLSFPSLQQKIDVLAYLVLEMLAALATNASMRHAYPVSNKNLPAILLMLTRILMKIHKKQHLEPQTIGAFKFSVR